MSMRFLRHYRSSLVFAGLLLFASVMIVRQVIAGQKLYLKGVSYGPFAPNERGDTFAPPEQTRRDFLQLRELGANLLRIYYAPPRWFLDLAAESGLKALVDIPWPKHLCFLDSDE